MAMYISYVHFISWKENFCLHLGRIRSSAVEEEFDFTDSTYQEQLPAHARSTAAMVSWATIVS